MKSEIKTWEVTAFWDFKNIKISRSQNIAGDFWQCCHLTIFLLLKCLRGFNFVLKQLQKGVVPLMQDTMPQH